MAFALILFEVIFAAMDMGASLLKVHQTFHFSAYFLMYILMILINLRFLLFAEKYLKLVNKTPRQINNMETGIIIYMTLVMCWGAWLSLMDQGLYGQLTVFMVNMMICSVVFFMEIRKTLIPYSASTLILFVGLPFFQNESDVLIGHYANSTVFIGVCLLVSRVLFRNYLEEFRSRELLKNTNDLLEKEIAQNKIINMRLAETNLQLKQLSLLDELTGIPNRRFFRNFIDIAFDGFARDGGLFSIIMIDIDYFKGYNDRYGHVAGDRVLKEVAEQINSIVKHATDFAARWGGEEFIYASFNTSTEETARIAELIRNKVLELKIPHESSRVCPHISISLGVSTFRVKSHKDISRSIEAADRALYTAKTSGRNCISTIGEGHEAFS